MTEVSESYQPAKKLAAISPELQETVCSSTDNDGNDTDVSDSDNESCSSEAGSSSFEDAETRIAEAADTVSD